MGLGWVGVYGRELENHLTERTGALAGVCVWPGASLCLVVRFDAQAAVDAEGSASVNQMAVLKEGNYFGEMALVSVTR